MTLRLGQEEQRTKTKVKIDGHLDTFRHSKQNDCSWVMTDYDMATL